MIIKEKEKKMEKGKEKEKERSYCRFWGSGKGKVSYLFYPTLLYLYFDFFPFRLPSSLSREMKKRIFWFMWGVFCPTAERLLYPTSSTTIFVVVVVVIVVRSQSHGSPDQR